MTPEQASIVRQFKNMIDLIQVGPDGYALPDQGLELEVLSRNVLKVDTALIGKENGPAARSALRLADTTAKWLEEMISGRRDPAIAEQQFQARAEFIEPDGD